MVVSRGLLRLHQLRLRVHRLNGRNDLCNLGLALHPLEPALAVAQHCPQPPLEHHAATRTRDVALAVPDQREHALDRVGVRRQEQAKRRHDTAVEAEDYQDCGDVSS